MSDWYYVENNDRFGPISEEELIDFFKSSKLNEDSYIWTAGFENWVKASDVDQFAHVFNKSQAPDVPGMPPIIDDPIFVTYDWSELTEDDKVISIKIGMDRGVEREIEYGPYTYLEIKRAHKENRINDQTLVHIPGADDWITLAQMPIYERVFNQKPTLPSESERRSSIRKPFVARMFVHDKNILLEGICRDISTGGLQVLVSDNPFDVGEEITLNVHPDNTDYHFVTTGLIVRNLEANQGFALRFVNLDNDAEDAIKSYITHN